MQRVYFAAKKSFSFPRRWSHLAFGLLVFVAIFQFEYVLPTGILGNFPHHHDVDFEAFLHVARDLLQVVQAVDVYLCELTQQISHFQPSFMRR